MQLLSSTNLQMNDVLRGELAAAGIEVIEPTAEEIAKATEHGYRALVKGQLRRRGKPVMKFIRCWYYWEANGRVPYRAAMALWKDPVGKQYVRAAGVSHGDDPRNWLDYDHRGAYIECYHIDDQDGLNLFVAELRKRGVVD